MDSPYSINVRDYSKIKEQILTVHTKSRSGYLYVDDEANIYANIDDGSIVEIVHTILANKLNVKQARGMAVDETNNIMYPANASAYKITKGAYIGI